MRLPVALLTAMLALPLVVSAQDTAKPLASFTVTVETTEQDVVLTCAKGCTWETLRFPLAVTKTWVGESRVHSPDSDAAPDEGPFLFAVYANQGQADRGLDLLCEWGCQWQSVAITPRNVPWVIDECEIIAKKVWKPTDADVPCAERRRER